MESVGGWPTSMSLSAAVVVVVVADVDGVLKNDMMPSQVVAVNHKEGRC